MSKLLRTLLPVFVMVCNVAALIAQPIITTFYPATALPGQTVSIRGINFTNVKKVMFGNVPSVSFNVLSSSEIAAIVPPDARGGNIFVETVSGTSIRHGFSPNYPPGNALLLGYIAPGRPGPYIEIPDAASLKSDAVTVECWVKIAAPGEHVGVIIVKPNSRGPNGSYIEDYLVNYQVSPNYPPSVQFNATMSNNGTQRTASTPYLSKVGKWVFLAAVFTKDNLSIYIDGELVKSAPTGFPLDHGNFPVTIGAYPTHNKDFALAAIDELRIFNNDRSSQVAADMQANSIEPLTKGLAAYYNFDEGTPGSREVGTVIDQTGNNNTGKGYGFELQNAKAEWVKSFPAIASFSPVTAQEGLISIRGVNFKDGISVLRLDGQSAVNNISGGASGTISVRPGINHALTIQGFDFTPQRPKFPFYYGQYPGNNLNFDGHNDFVTIPDAACLKSQTITLEAWIKPLTGDGHVIAKPNSRGPGGSYFEDYFISLEGNRFTATASNNGNQKVARQTIPYQQGTWYHVAAVYSSTSIKLYVNGALQQTVPTGFALDHGTAPITLGAHPLLHAYTACSIDELQIYNVERSSAEITKDMASTNANDPALAAYYSFDQGNAGANNIYTTTLYDASLNNNNATLQGFGLTGAASNFVDRKPAIAMFSPATATTGQTVTIYGSDFTNVTAVKFGNSNALSFTVESKNVIKAVVGGGTTGHVSVTVNGYEIKRAGFVHEISPGNALAFDGVNNYGLIPSTPALKTPVITVEAWVNPSTSSGYVLSKPNTRGPGGSFLESYFIKYSADRFMAVMSNNGNQKEAVQQSKFSKNKWYFVTGIFTAASVKLYVDGVLQQEVPTGFNIDQSDYPVTIGAHPYLHTFTKMIIDEVRIFNTDRSSFAQADMASQIDAGTSGLAAYYNFDNWDVAHVIDHSANNITASLHNFIPPRAASGVVESYPEILSADPLAAAEGQNVTIKGVNFTGTLAVYFGSFSASAIKSISRHQIVAAPVSGSISGNIAVFESNASATYGGFKLLIPPVIQSITPNIGIAGTAVTIKGSNFKKVTSVKFGGVTAPAWAVSIDGTNIVATVGSGAAGNVEVTTADGTASIGHFTFEKYCTAGSNTNNNKIVRVDVGSKTYNVSTYANGFADHTFKDSAAMLDTSSVVEVTRNANTAGYKLTAWCDFDQDGDFDDAGENIFVPGSDGPALTTRFNMVVPITAKPGKTRMRIRLSNIDGINPCGGSGDGSVFDINVIIPQWPAPVISSFTPVSAPTGATVTITGSNFTRATTVAFGGVNAHSFTVISPAQITAVVGNGKSGDVTVKGSAVAAHSGFIYLPPPVITSLSAASGVPGSAVRIFGQNFEGVNKVTVGGVDAQIVDVSSVINIIIPDGAVSGAIEVTSPNGTGTYNGFIIRHPVITGVAPLTAPIYTRITITGKDLYPATVTIGGVPVTIESNSDNSITTIIGEVASGDIRVTTKTGTAVFAGFTYLGPVIKSISPLNAYPGAKVTIAYAYCPYVTDVSFGGVPAKSFKVLADGARLEAIVGEGGSGKVVINGIGGQGVYEGFGFLGIQSFSPQSAGRGDEVSIHGEGFEDITAVSFGGVPAKSFQVLSPKLIRAIVGIGATGKVSVTAKGAATVEKEGFTFILPPAPVITSLSPATAGNGDYVSIKGSNLDFVKTVTFGGVQAASIRVISDNEITAVVGYGSSGDVVATSASGTAVFSGFTYIPYCFASGDNNQSYEKIKSIEVDSFTNVGTNFSIGYEYLRNTLIPIGVGAHNMKVKVTNSNVAALVVFIDLNQDGDFDDAGEQVYASPNIANSFSFGFNIAPPFVSGTTRMRVRLTGAYSGVNRTSCGSSQYGQVKDYTVVLPTFYRPKIETFSPASGYNGDIVTITGHYFSFAGAVRFGGTNAHSFSVVSDSVITAVVSGGSTGNIHVVTPGGTGVSADIFTYIQPVQLNAGNVSAQSSSVAGKPGSAFALQATPNPTKTSFTLFVSGNNSQPVEIKVTDMLGRVLYRNRGAANHTYVFGDGFAQGMYVAEVLQGKTVKAIKLIKVQ